MGKADKIRDMEYELGRWKKKASDQQVKIKQLEKERDDALMAKEIAHRIVDSICIAIVRKFGRQVSDEAWEQDFSAVMLESVLRDYRLDAVRAEKGNGYIFKVSRRNPLVNAPKSETDTESAT